MVNTVFFFLVMLPCALGPLVILGILLIKGKFSGDGFVEGIRGMLGILWILYGVSLGVFLVLGVLYRVLIGY